MNEFISRRALAIKQSDFIDLYLFALTADEIDQVAELSRVSRSDAGELIGYQRDEVRRHVESITEYLDSGDPLLPNAIILAVSPRVKFTKSRGPNVDDGLAAAGTLEIPVPVEGESKPAWIVDGQQRSLAARRAKNHGSFPIPVAAFVADNIEVQRDQFVRVNSSRPLPVALVTELLPKISSGISGRLATKKLPSEFVDRFNSDPASPFYRLIKRPSLRGDARQRAVITDTSLIKGLEESLQAPSGALFPYRNIATGETDTDGIWALLLTYWTAVQETFPNAWGLPPTQSRLMHGAGLRSMGRLMDRLMANIDPTADDAVEIAKKELALIEDRCAWTSGTWQHLDDRPWNQWQNVPRDIREMSSFLIRSYVQARRVS